MDDNMRHVVDQRIDDDDAKQWPTIPVVPAGNATSKPTNPTTPVDTPISFRFNAAPSPWGATTAQRTDQTTSLWPPTTTSTTNAATSPFIAQLPDPKKQNDDKQRPTTPVAGNALTRSTNPTTPVDTPISFFNTPQSPYGATTNQTNLIYPLGIRLESPKKTKEKIRQEELDKEEMVSYRSPLDHN